MSFYHLRASIICAAIWMLFWCGGTVLMAQDTVAEQDVYLYTGHQRVPLRLDLSQIGVVSDQGSLETLRTAVTKAAEIRHIEKVSETFFVLTLSGARSREALWATVRAVAEDDAIDRAGLILRSAGTSTPMILTDQLIVQFEPEISRAEIESRCATDGLTILRENPFVENQLLLQATKQTVGDALELANLYYEEQPTVFSHPNLLVPTEERSEGFIPDDPLFDDQWPHRNTGQNGGTPDGDIDTPLAWEITRGDDDVVIAIIDSGFDVAHPDLVPNLWSNPGEGTVPDGVDNDLNGFVDDIHGWSFVGCSSPQTQQCGSSTLAGTAHGTEVAGVAAARGDNQLGVTGSCPECSLMFLRRRSGFGDTWEDSLTFRYALAHDADIANSSWGTPYIPFPCLDALCMAIEDAATLGRGGKGMVIHWAMNNLALRDCSEPLLDISSLETVIAISRSTNLEQVSLGGFGNCMDLLAPTHGGTLDITTTYPGGSYTPAFGGTSAASPLVAGVTGLMLSVQDELSRIEVQRLLQDTADKIEDSQAGYQDGNGFSRSPSKSRATHGWGRVNAYEAVRIAAPTARPPVPHRGDGVDIFMRDNRLDWGNTEQPSYTLFETVRGTIPHWVSVDIKIDAPPFSFRDTSSQEFEDFQHENAEAGEINRVYVRIHNRGPRSASEVKVKLLWAFAGLGLPPLPADLWTSFPGDPTQPSSWTPLPCHTAGFPSACTIDDLEYSGSSVALTVEDGSQVVRFNFLAPTIDPNLPEPDHFCLLAIADSPQDPAAARWGDPEPEDFVVGSVVGNDNNVTLRNIKVVDTAEIRHHEELTYIRNPFSFHAEVVLQAVAPEGWNVRLEGIEFDHPFTLEPGEERLTRVEIDSPGPGARGQVSLFQRSRAEGLEDLGGMTYLFENSLLPRLPELELTKTATPGVVSAGGAVIYTLTVANNGPVGATEVVVTDDLPSAVMWTDDSCGAGPPGGASGKTLRWEIGTLPAGAVFNCIIEGRVGASATGSLSNTATVTAAEPDFDTANNTDGVTIEVQNDIADCNSNGIADAVDLANGTSEDVNNNGRPDECETHTVSCYLAGTAVGGAVSVTIDGFFATCTVIVATSPGESTGTVVANIAAAINADSCLQAQDIVAEGSGTALLITGFALGQADITLTFADAGLRQQIPPVKIPTLSSWGLLILVLLLMTSGWLLSARLQQEEKR